ncbi:MAG: electron transfer flavoprotein subunit alpha/FixB family protein [Desulfobacteraceae bacterium]|nr:MAG: electron transfer flavoprotein subunit alpha/FixB family protein [Desulfobacteraceae bacterium]
MKKTAKEIWVFGDYRNYFRNRVTLQLLAKSVELAKKTGSQVCAVIFGNGVQEYVNEYIAHGAEKVYVIDHDSLHEYHVETYVVLMEMIVRKYQPEMLLVGATCFGREFAPRVAKRVHTGLTADCVDLEINGDGLLVQTAPAFGGNLLAKIITPHHRPQMATVRAGVFKELPHDYHASGKVIPIPVPKRLPENRVRLIRSKHEPPRTNRIEDAKIVVCGGRGMGSKQKFKKLFALAELLGGEVGATRPVVYSGWADDDSLIGQAGRQIKPLLLLSFGISGAIQHTAALSDAKFIIAVNKNPEAPMMKMADVAIVADANQVCSALIREIRERIRS